jgi:hypothetical protein
MVERIIAESFSLYSIIPAFFNYVISLRYLFVGFSISLPYLLSLLYSFVRGLFLWIPAVNEKYPLDLARS